MTPDRSRAAWRRTTLGLSIAAAVLCLGAGAPRAQFDAKQCFNALMLGPTGLGTVAERPGASHGDYLALLAQNIDTGAASGHPLIYVNELWDMSQLDAAQKAAMRDTLAKLRAAIGDYIVVAMASELRRITPIYLVSNGRFLPPKVKSIRTVGTPPSRYVYEIDSPTGDHGRTVPAMSILVSRNDCKLIDLSLGDSSFLVSIGQDIKAIGDLAEAERQLRAKAAEISAAQ